MRRVRASSKQWRDSIIPGGTELAAWALWAMLIASPTVSHATAVKENYVWSALSEVDNLNFVEISDNLVQATLQHVSVNRFGEETEVHAVLFGRIDRENVYLKVIAQLGPTDLLSPEAVVTGRLLRNGRLLLRVNGRMIAMQPASTDQYRVRVAALHEMGEFYASLAAQKKVETGMKEFVRWAHERAAVASEVEGFYWRRRRSYNACLELVRRMPDGMAYGHPPGCVTRIHNDARHCNLERQRALALPKQLAMRAGAIEGALAPVAEALNRQAALAVAASETLSPKSPGHKAFEHLAAALRRMSPVNDFRSFPAYRAAIPFARKAIQKAVNAAKEGDAKVKALVLEIDFYCGITGSGIRS